MKLNLKVEMLTKITYNFNSCNLDGQFEEDFKLLRRYYWKALVVVKIVRFGLRVETKII